MRVRVASGAYLFALGGCTATLAVRDVSAVWWLLAASALSGVVAAVTGG